MMEKDNPSLIEAIRCLTEANSAVTQLKEHVRAAGTTLENNAELDRVTCAIQTTVYHLDLASDRLRLLEDVAPSRGTAAGEHGDLKKSKHDDCAELSVMRAEIEAQEKVLTDRSSRLAERELSLGEREKAFTALLQSSGSHAKKTIDGFEADLILFFKKQAEKMSETNSWVSREILKTVSETMTSTLEQQIGSVFDDMSKRIEEKAIDAAKPLDGAVSRSSNVLKRAPKKRVTSGTSTLPDQSIASLAEITSSLSDTASKVLAENSKTDSSLKESVSRLQGISQSSEDTKSLSSQRESASKLAELVQAIDNSTSKLAGLLETTEKSQVHSAPGPCSLINDELACSLSDSVAKLANLADRAQQQQDQQEPMRQQGQLPQPKRQAQLPKPLHQRTPSPPPRFPPQHCSSSTPTTLTATGGHVSSKECNICASYHFTSECYFTPQGWDRATDTFRNIYNFDFHAAVADAPRMRERNLRKRGRKPSDISTVDGYRGSGSTNYHDVAVSRKRSYDDTGAGGYDAHRPWKRSHEEANPASASSASSSSAPGRFPYYIDESLDTFDHMLPAMPSRSDRIFVPSSVGLPRAQLRDELKWRVRKEGVVDKNKWLWRFADGNSCLWTVGNRALDGTARRGERCKMCKVKERACPRLLEKEVPREGWEVIEQT